MKRFLKRVSPKRIIARRRDWYVGFIIFVVFVAGIFAFLYYLLEIAILVSRGVDEMMARSASDAANPLTAEDFRNYATGIAAFLAALAAAAATLLFQLIRVWINERTANTAEQVLLTDRITQATEQLGSESIPVRVGGILALKRLLEDVPNEREVLLKTINFYVIHEATQDAGISQRKQLRVDIQAALEIITTER